MSYEAAFRELSEAQVSFWRRDEPALWMREGHEDEEPVAIRVMFNEKPRIVDVDGFTTNSSTPQATFQLSDIAAIDVVRASQEDTVFLNDCRDKLTINGVVYAIESCTHDGYGWITTTLRRTAA